MGISVRVTDRCAGHGQCYSNWPELFAPDDEGYAVLVSTPTEHDVDAARQAARICPEGAIEVTTEAE